MSRDSCGEKCKFGVSVWMFVNVLSSQFKKHYQLLEDRALFFQQQSQDLEGQTHQTGQVHRPEVAV